MPPCNANVAGREDAVLAAQAAGAAPSSVTVTMAAEISDGVLAAGVFVVRRNNEFLEAAKKRGEAGAASQSDDAEAAGKSFRFGLAFFSCGHSGLRSWCHFTERI